MNSWWAGLAPAQATVSCGGDEHRLRWEAGQLHALDHDDVESERTLAALGGQRCACVDFLDAWERHRDDIRVLVLASRGPMDQLVEPEDDNGQFGVSGPGVMRAATRRSGAGLFGFTMGSAQALPSGWTAYGPTGRASKQAEAENELFALLGLGGGLADRLSASVAASWRDRLGQRDRAVTRARPQLRAALHGRAHAALRTWLGGTAVESDLKMLREGAEPRLLSQDGVVKAELPFGWLVDVWAKGLATIWGRFCLSAATDDGRTWTLKTVAPDLGRPQRMTIRL